MKIYFANGLFALADRMFNEVVVDKIRKMDGSIEVYLPQENGDINDKMNYADSIKIAQEDNKELLSSDLVVAILDGDTMDDGVASEIGVAFGKEIPVIGVYTDLRQHGFENPEKLEAVKGIGENPFAYINNYTIGLIKMNGIMVNNIDDMLTAIKNYTKN
ncbi:nucleoside 2-deoxyribosyltransferase [Companilactobacillus huachuanensis]|uniref:Nucleoside 2-deoxyribosyltransferase n=1 Tax=Companilactobacillus huachuanensis TaxID=2559914 RepID=A0ABW1RHU3_9LACO|nr:nucleoside 2-deoxyribosyltransferase [Companilactobacillus huachuanensis]